MITRAVAPLLVLLALTAGCGATIAGSPRAEGVAEASGVASGVAASEAAAATAAGTAGDPGVDACSLVKPDEVQALIGKNDGGKGSGPGNGTCEWTNPDELSVTVEIGTEGTALRGLPPWDPAFGPEKPVGDGMRSIGAGQVEFVAGTRDCSVQVVTDPGSDTDTDKALKLVGLVRSRLS